MTTALVGYTGFVGTTLRGQTVFDDHYNSANIQDIRGKHYDLVVCAGAPAAKWKANQDPAGDLANLQMLMGHLAEMTADEFVLISTVDVYKTPVEVDEATPINAEGLHAYGANRYRLEEFVRERFAGARVVRLPGLFGAGLRKNFLFDLVHRGESEWTHCDSVFQFYDMANLWRDLQVVRAGAQPLVNFATEPVRAGDVARHSFDMDYTFQTEKPPVRYDMRTRHADLFGAAAPYMTSAETVFAQIRVFAAQEQANS